MNRVFLCGAALARVALLFVLPVSLAAQEPSTGDRPQPKNLQASEAPKAPGEEEINLAATQTAWAAIEDDAGIETAVKDLIRAKYKQAIESLQLAEEYRTAATGFRQAIQTAPGEAETKRQELAELPSEADAALLNVVFDSIVELQRDLAARNAGLQSLADELEKATTDLTALREQRPTTISARIPTAAAELTETQTKLQAADVSKDATSPGRVADRTKLLASEAKLQAEVEMLKQEKRSLSAREELLEARCSWLIRRVANSKAAIATLKQREESRLKQEAEQVGSVVDRSRESLDKNDVSAQALAEEVGELAKQFDEIVDQSTKIAASQKSIVDRLTRLQDESERLSRELNVEGAGSAMAQLAFNLQEHLLDPRVYALTSVDSLPSLESMRLASINVDQHLRDHEAISDRFSHRNSDAIDQLVQARLEILEKLKSQYKQMIPAMITLEASRRQLKTEGHLVHEDISDQLVWIRSSPPINVQDLKDLPGGIRWLFSAKHWREFCGALEYTFSRAPFRFVGILSLVLVLLVTRPRMIRALEATGLDIRRVSLDRYWLTVEALIWTVLLAAPLAILLAFLGWACSHTPAPSAWMRGLAVGTPSASQIVFMLAFASELCRPGGLGNVHFAWSQPTLDAVRGTLFRFGIVYIPAGLIIASTLYGDASAYSNGVGRLSLMAAKLWIVILLWQQFGGKHGLVAKLVERQPSRLLTRTRIVWFPLLLMAPIAFFVLAARGYVIASIELSRGTAQTIGLIFLAEVAYWMTLRWFSLKARHIAVTERMQRLRAARESAEANGEGEALAVLSDDEQVLDLATIGLQTRRLVRSLLSVAIAITILSLWSANFPVASALSAIVIPFTDGVDLFEFGQALLIFVIAWVIIKNLPGVLELSIFRESSIDVGTRHAITTLCRYALAAIGIAAIFNVLNFDWTKFGWMAAAMGVGLGFGLQEVITNFVCGLILLFERPVRIGDVVTIQGVTGTVTKIRMRATTITNWDRQEFVVPNKSLITDTILNWTLSASVSRIVITVGVAYGTRTEEARQILLNVANDHPLIMKEPAPMATFEKFADSSLTLCLRCYVPDLDYRLRTISELHTEIDHRFGDARIEIAFPQQDIHVRSGLETLQNRERPEAAVSSFDT